MLTSHVILSVTLKKPAFWRWYAFDDVDPDGVADLAAYCGDENGVIMPQPIGWHLDFRFQMPAGWSELSLCRSRPDGTFDGLEFGERHRLGLRHPTHRYQPCVTWTDLRAVAKRSMVYEIPRDGWFKMFDGLDGWEAILLLAPWVRHRVDDSAGLAAHRRVVADILAGRGLFDSADADRLAALLLPAPAAYSDLRPGYAVAEAMAAFRRQLEIGHGVRDEP